MNRCTRCATAKVENGKKEEEKKKLPSSNIYFSLSKAGVRTWGKWKSVKYRVKGRALWILL